MSAETASTLSPAGFDALRARILEQRHSLPKRIAQIAAYALDNPDDVAFGTASSVATAAGVQPSTLVRFAQHLGFDGFTSLQAVFRERLRERTSNYDERLIALRSEVTEGDADHRVLEGFLSASAKSLDVMARSVEPANLARSIGVLAGAKTIYVLARRRSYPVASYITYAFGKLKVRNQLVESASGLNAEIISFATEQDAVLAISFSPYAPATVDDVRSLAERGVPIVAITDSAFSPLVQHAKTWFEVAEADFGGFRTLAATMALSMTLAVGVADHRQVRSVNAEQS